MVPNDHSKVVCVIRSLVNAGSLQLGCVRVLQEALFMPILRLGCADGQPYRSDSYYENIYSSKYMDKRVLWHDERIVKRAF